MRLVSRFCEDLSSRDMLEILRIRAVIESRFLLDGIVHPIELRRRWRSRIRVDIHRLKIRLDTRRRPPSLVRTFDSLHRSTNYHLSRVSRQL